MNCLHCGDCCLRMSPLSAPEPCPYLIIDGTFHFCGIYAERPEECINHKFPSRHCPIGIDILKLESTTEIQTRLEFGYLKTELL